MFYDLNDPEMVEKILPEKAYRTGKAMKENSIVDETGEQPSAEEINKGKKARKWGRRNKNR